MQTLINSHSFSHQFLRSSGEIKEKNVNGKRHYITPSGAVYPSVTTVLSMQDKTHLIEWRNRVGDEEADRITKEACRRGEKFHSTIERYLHNDNELFMDLLVKSHFLQVKNTLKDLIELVYALEIPLYSDRIKVAGRCDCIAQINGLPHIVDFKTSKKEKEVDSIDGYRMQCAAYAIMANELYNLNIRNFCIVISNLHENHPTVVFGKVKDYLPGFVELRKMFK